VETVLGEVKMMRIFAFAVMAIFAAVQDVRSQELFTTSTPDCTGVIMPLLTFLIRPE
jgi:hypothetical protein